MGVAQIMSALFGQLLRNDLLRIVGPFTVYAQELQSRPFSDEREKEGVRKALETLKVLLPRSPDTVDGKEHQNDIRTAINNADFYDAESVNLDLNTVETINEGFNAADFCDMIYSTLSPNTLSLVPDVQPRHSQTVTTCYQFDIHAVDMHVTTGLRPLRTHLP
jgi:hypothetical protein